MENFVTLLSWWPFPYVLIVSNHLFRVSNSGLAFWMDFFSLSKSPFQKVRVCSLKSRNSHPSLYWNLRWLMIISTSLSTSLLFGCKFREERKTSLLSSWGQMFTKSRFLRPLSDTLHNLEIFPIGCMLSWYLLCVYFRNSFPVSLMFCSKLLQWFCVFSVLAFWFFNTGIEFRAFELSYISIPFFTFILTQGLAKTQGLSSLLVASVPI